MKSLVKVIGNSGQISLGKEHAGRQVLIEELGPGEWRVRTATVVPDGEKWLHTADMAQSLEKALDWERRYPPAETKLPALRRKISDEPRTRRPSRKARS